jgi:prevent-host-death family protein
METIEAGELQAGFEEVLDRVETGEAFTITEDGVTVAKLVPIDDKPKPDLQKVLEETRAFRKAHAGQGITIAEIKEWINEGRRM